MRLAVLASLLVLTAATISAQTTTTLSSETSNNTAACSAAGSPSYCQAGFTPMSDSVSGTFNPAPGNVSTEDVHQVLYPGATTKIFTYFQPWFCMQAGSTATGAGTLCNKHIQVGYTSNSAATVAGQLNDMERRGFDGTIIDWYGTDQSVGPGYDATTQLIRDNLAARCSGAQSCPMYFAILADEGSYKWTKCPQNNGVDQTTCLTNAINGDMDYLNSNYFGSNAYLRVNNLTQQVDPNGRPIVLFFICEECWANPKPNWANVWAQVRAHTNTYGSTTPQLYFIFRNQNGFTHTETNGAFAWVNWYGSNDPYGFVYLDNFYSTAKSVTTSNPTLITFGGGWKGFDENLAPWITSAGRTIQQQCGNTWLQSLQRASGYFGTSKQLPFLGVVTWNDYEEGTQIETGIDNCLSLSASVSGNVLSWTPTFSASSGSESTVHHYSVFDSIDGQNLKEVATLQPATHSVDLGTVNLLSGSSHTLFVKAVGQPSIQNQMSNAVSYSSPVQLSSLAISPSSVVGGNSATGTVTLSAPAPSSGAIVTVQSNNGGVASVPSSVTIAAGATGASFAISTTAVTTSTPVTITASYNGTSAPATLTVNPASASSVSLNPASVGGSLTSTGTVTLTGRAPAGGAVVTLASSNTAAATVPASVTVPAGATSASFTVSTKVVAATSTATISATYGGTTKAATLTVNVTPTSLTLSPSTVKGKSSAIGTVTLSGPAPNGGAVVALSSSRSTAKLPSSVTVPAGATSAKFTVTTSNVGSTTQVTITATYFGVKTSAVLTVTR